MTKEQKQEIVRMRRENCGYSVIAKSLGVSVSTVKAYCQRNGLAGNRSVTDLDACRECGKPLRQPKGRKKIKFCSPACRQKWWNAHPDAVKQKAVYNYTCAHCGKPFTAYGNKHRKYCSPECYRKDRFGGDGHEQ